MKLKLSDKIKIPEQGEKIRYEQGQLVVPNNPIIPYIVGDGIGPDIWNAAMPVFNAGVEAAYGNEKKIEWMEIYAGEKAYEIYKNIFPDDVLIALNEYVVSIKGPLTTPVGGGHRSLNVTLRQELDLYACVRPVKYYEGVTSPVRHPEKVDILIYRENTEDVYAGIEWEAETKQCKRIIEHLNNNYNLHIPFDSGIGIKPMSRKATRRLVRKAINNAFEEDYKSITLMHKGNIMKYTEGAFKEWGYKLAAYEFDGKVITEDELYEKYSGNLPENKIVIKDRIADNLFQQLLLHPEDYDIVVAPNLNGDYASDFLAAQVGGLGLAPGGNIGDGTAVFEATHGSAPKFANTDTMNPSSLILSGAMMFKYLGWKEAWKKIDNAVAKCIKKGLVTQDLAGERKDVKVLKTSEFGKALVENME